MTVLVIGPSTTSSGWLMEKATARAKSTEYHEIGSGIQTTDPASNFMVPGEGFEPDRGVARRDSHEPIARGALSGSQSRALAPPQGASPPRTAAKCAAMSPPDYEREVPSLSHPPPWGFNAPDTKKIRQGPNYRPCRIFLVPGEGFEPPRETHTPLKRTRLPIPPARHGLPRPLYGAYQKPSKASEEELS